MTYRTPESVIRSILGGGPSIVESLASDHLAPGNKSSPEERLNKALMALHSNNVESASVVDGKISVKAADMNMAVDVLDRALQKGFIDVKPSLTSPEAIEMPEPHVPAPEFAKEETVVTETRAEDETEQNSGEIDKDGTVHLDRRSLNNRMQNQIKKVDEEIEQIDELSTSTLKNYAKKARTVRDTAEKSGDDNTLGKRVHGIKLAINAGKRNKPFRQFEESQQLDELSYGRLKSYASKGAQMLAKGNPLDKAHEKRRRMVDLAQQKKHAKVASAAGLRENIDPINTVKRILSEASGLRLKATIHSDCGKHTAKIYKDSEYGEHRVKFHINGKHHEPADYHTSDYDDAHGTAKLELARMTKLNGALKEATEEEVNELLEQIEQIDELSKATLTSYVDKASKDMKNHWRDDKTRHRKWDNRVDGVLLAKKKLDVKKEETEAAEDGATPFQIDELSRGTLLSYVSKSARSADHASGVDERKGDKRRAGIDLAFKKLAKEEVEQVDELSKPTLNRYVYAASHDIYKTNDASDPKVKKRAKGLSKAADKLSEEVELITEKKSSKNDDVESSKKFFVKHPQVDAIAKTLHSTRGHFNYVQDAVDHVYNNHARDLKYEDFDKMVPHLQDHFKKAGLK